MSSSSGDEAANTGTTGNRRASGRVRRAPERLQPGTTKSHKKRNSDDSESSANEQDSQAASETESDSEESEAENDTAFKSPTKKKKKERQPKAVKVPGAAKRKATNGGGGGRKKKNKDQNDGEEGEMRGAAVVAGAGIGKGDFKINDDNPIFNAIHSPDAAIETIVEDWMETFGTEPGPAMAELVNFLLRSCGCNSSVDEHQALDEDGVVETLSDIQDEFKNETSLAYPVVSRSGMYKKFRSSLATFIRALYESASSSEHLYESNFCDVFLPWIVTLSSSKIRSFRHTATLFGLHSVTGLSVVHAALKNEHATAQRAREAEAKKGRKDKARLRELEKTAKEIHAKQTAVEDHIESLWKTIFMNRYRDTDAGIRSECVSGLGEWTKVNPDYWVDGRYVRYIGWVLSDDSKEARRESVRALFSLYAKDSHIGSLQHFTERFKGPLVQMAVGDIDTTIRVQTIQVLRRMDTHAMLEQEERDEIAKLVFETEPRVRKAAADFFKGLWDEEVERREKELSAGRAADKAGAGFEAVNQVQMKSLAELLIKYGDALDGVTNNNDEDEEEVEQVDLVEVKTHRGRVAFAVEALWDKLDPIRDWQSIMQFLLLDHSGADASNKSKAGRNKKSKGKGAAANADSDDLDDSCKLTEEEETLLVEVLLASITRVIEAANATTKKGKEQDDDVKADATRVIIDALPRLFAKHQMVSARIIDILAIPRLLVLDMYLDLRMVTAYEGLWDAVTGQFFKHSDADVLDQAVQTILFLRKAATLGNTNADKMAELEEKLVAALREAVEGKDLESDALEEDDLHSITSSFSRFDRLYKVVNLTDALLGADATISSVYDIVESVVERGRLGYKDEAAMVQHALSIHCTYLMWSAFNVTKSASEADGVDYGAIADLVERRKSILEKFEEFAIGQTSNATDDVKQTALVLLLDTHNLAQAITSAKSDPDGKLADLRLTFSDEFQSRCAGSIEAEIERRRTELDQFREEDEDHDNDQEKAAASDEDESDSDNEDDEPSSSKKKKQASKSKKQKKGKAAAGSQAKEPAVEKTPADIRAKRIKEQARLVATRKFERAIFPFVRAIHCGSIDLIHSAVILPHYERFGAVYDSWCKLLVQDLRDEGIYAKSGELVSNVVTTSLQTAFENLIDSESASDDQLVAVGRLLTSATAVRGSQLAIVRRLGAEDLVALHTSALRFVIKKIASFESANKTSSRNRALAYFKALAHLLLGVEGRSALTLNSTLESLLEANEVEVPVASKTWEPLRAYKKRLVTAMAKDPRIQQAAAKKNSNEAAAGQQKKQSKEKKQNHDDENENEDEWGDLGEEPQQQRANGSSPSKNKTKGAAAEEQPDEEMEDDDEEEVRSLLVGSSSPAASKRSLEDSDEEEEQQANDDNEDNVSLVSLTEVKRTSKRARR